MVDCGTDKPRSPVKRSFGAVVDTNASSHFVTNEADSVSESSDVPMCPLQTQQSECSKVESIN